MRQILEPGKPRSYRHAILLQKLGAKGLEKPRAAVVGGAPTQTKVNGASTRFDRRAHKRANARRTGGKSICLGSACERKPRRARHLDHRDWRARCVRRAQVRSIDRTTQRTAHRAEDLFSPARGAHGIERSLATVCHGDSPDLDRPPKLRRGALCALGQPRLCLGARGRTLEGVHGK